MNCVVVTGATGKIGVSVVKRLLSNGDRVIALGKNPDSVNKLHDAIPDPEQQERISYYAVDMMSETAVLDIMAHIAKAGTPPTGLVNNARSLDVLNVEDGCVSRADFQNQFLLDVVVPYELTMGLARTYKGKLLSVVNVASMYGIVAPTPYLYEGSLDHSPINYGVSKAALIHLTKELAVRLAPDVRVNAVSFGGVKGRVDEAFIERYANLCPAGRMLEDEEVAGPIEFLLSENSSSMTGHNLAAEGGWSIW